MNKRLLFILSIIIIGFIAYYCVFVNRGKANRQFVELKRFKIQSDNRLLIATPGFFIEDTFYDWKGNPIWHLDQAGTSWKCPVANLSDNGVYYAQIVCSDNSASLRLFSQGKLINSMDISTAARGVGSANMQLIVHNDSTIYIVLNRKMRTNIYSIHHAKVVAEGSVEGKCKISPDAEYVIASSGNLCKVYSIHSRDSVIQFTPQIDISDEKFIDDLPYLGTDEGFITSEGQIYSHSRKSGTVNIGQGMLMPSYHTYFVSYNNNVRVNIVIDPSSRDQWQYITLPGLSTGRASKNGDYVVDYGFRHYQSVQEQIFNRLFADEKTADPYSVPGYDSYDIYERPGKLLSQLILKHNTSDALKEPYISSDGRTVLIENYTDDSNEVTEYILYQW